MSGHASKAAADFFAGIGLVSLGLVRSGWEVTYAVDHSDEKRQLYEGHFGPGHYYVKDVAGVSGDDVPDVALAHASFPCTDTSVAGARHGLDGNESSSIWSFIRILAEMGIRRPPLILLENVEGFLTSSGGQDMRTAIELMGELGYSADPLLIDASFFVPQSRVRLFIIGILEPPSATHEIAEVLSQDHQARPKKLKAFIRNHPELPWRLRGLPELPIRQENLSSVIDEHEAWWPRERSDYLFSQMYERHKEIVRHMMRQDLFSYGTVFRRMRKRAGKKQSTAELRSDGIAGCLRTPKGGSARQIVVRAGKGRFDARLLNARECARLMGAADFKLAEEVSLNQALFGFGDAVCASVIEWLSSNYLNPVLAELATAGIGDGMSVKGQLSIQGFMQNDFPRTIDELPESDRPAAKAAMQAFDAWWQEQTPLGDDLPIRSRVYGALVTLERLLKDYNLSLSAHTTEKGAQVKRLTSHWVGMILSRFGEKRPLPREAGRTSRGNLTAVSDLLTKLGETPLRNLELESRNVVLHAMMKRLAWAAGEYHERARLAIEFNPQNNASETIANLLSAAEGPRIGAVAQHMVGAKLQVRFPDLEVENHGAFAADVQTNRRGDFCIGDTVFHVTVTPTDGHYKKCAKDVREGYRVYLLVRDSKRKAAEELIVEYSKHVAVQSIEAFVGQNLDELAAFSREEFRRRLKLLFETYNSRVSVAEADKSLLIEIPENLQDE